MCEGRDNQSVIDLLKSMMSKEQLKYVHTISMDMWKSYIKAAEDVLTDAEIVHDRFHLVKYLNEAIDKVRRREVKDNEILNSSRYALQKNEENRSKKQTEIFEQVMASNLEVTTTYYAKETFKTLFGLNHVVV